MLIVSFYLALNCSMEYIFNLTDGENILKVVYKKALPSTFEVGKDVVFSGKLVKENNEWIFKYE